MDKCNVCGENSVVNEDGINGNMRVCLECGAVNEEIEELSSNGEFMGTTISDGIGRAPNGVKASNTHKDPNRKPPGLDFGKCFIQKIGHEANFTSDMIVDSEQLYEKAIDEVYRVSDDVKSAMCIACLYCVARINRRGISLGDFLGLSRADRQKGLKRVGYFLKTLKTKYDVHLPVCCIGSQVGEMLLREGMSSRVCETAKQIVLCMELALVTQGRPASIFLHAAAYYASRTCEYEKYKKVTFPAFLTQNGFRSSTVILRTKAEMEKTLTALVKELPWVQASSVPIKNIFPYLQDALKYKTSLMTLAFRTAVEKLKAEQRSVSERELELEQSTKEAEIVQEESTELTEPNKPVNDINTESDVPVSKESEIKIENSSNTVHVFRKTHRIKKKRPNIEEKELSLRKKQKYSEMFKEENSDAEFSLGSDDDTEDYLLTPEQVKKRMILLNKLKTSC